jgi:ATP diphosphatase
MTAKASRVGFDWPSLEDIISKLQEEASELLEARAEQDPGRIADEVGDLLFVAVNIARFLGVDPETALRRSNRKFERRFRQVESGIKSQGREMREATLAEMDALWNQAKVAEKNSQQDQIQPGGGNCRQG